MDEEPLGGAANAAPRAAAAGDAHRVIAFASERSGFLAFVGEVALGCAELGLAGLTVDGKVGPKSKTSRLAPGYTSLRQGVYHIMNQCQEKSLPSCGGRVPTI